jgi:hypothetical protein
MPTETREQVDEINEAQMTRCKPVSIPVIP